MSDKSNTPRVSVQQKRNGETIAEVKTIPNPPAPAPEVKTKKASPFSMTEFMAKAQSISITVGTTNLTLDPKEFSTGSFGWGSNGKVTMMVDGKPVTCQLGLNLTVVGSKEAAR